MNTDGKQGRDCGTGMAAGEGKRPGGGVRSGLAALAVMAVLGGWGLEGRAENAPETAVPPAQLPAGIQAGEERAIALPGGEAMIMVWCPPGSFMMGSPEDEDGNFDDETLHRVTLTKGFWMAKYEVTQGQWQSVMGTNVRQQRAKAESDFPLCGEAENHPMYFVSWNEAQGFCRKAGLRLPTEAEWEYACRAGKPGPYAGNGELEDMGWFFENSDMKTHPVGRKRSNAWGLCDMHGNVSEWCADGYHGDLGNAEVTDPKGRAPGETHVVLRGGYWGDAYRYCRAAYRGDQNRTFVDASTGFRPCCSARQP